jgi:hypothetical protein
MAKLGLWLVSSAAACGARATAAGLGEAQEGRGSPTTKKRSPATRWEGNKGRRQGGRGRSPIRYTGRPGRAADKSAVSRQVVWVEYRLCRQPAGNCRPSWCNSSRTQAGPERPPMRSRSAGGLGVGAICAEALDDLKGRHRRRAAFPDRATSYRANAKRGTVYSVKVAAEKATAVPNFPKTGSYVKPRRTCAVEPVSSKSWRWTPDTALRRRGFRRGA